MRHITRSVFTYTSLFTASNLGRCRRGFLLRLCRLGLLGLLFLDRLGFRGSGFLGLWLGWGGLGLFFLLFRGRLILGLLSSFAAGAGLEFYDGLANGNGVFFADEEFLDGTRFGSVDSDVDLSSFRYQLAGNSPERGYTLSVSIVAISSSRSTKSPTSILDQNMALKEGLSGCSRFENCFNVPSVIDSAISGTLTIVSATSSAW